ncbi:MAG: RluA family pseudouridine synthase [Candidatus Pristimantibacillus sp.]
MQMRPYRRVGQWLELHLADLLTRSAFESDTRKQMEDSLPEAGSHPHIVRQWLLAHSLFPVKWINRLFSVGGIKWEGDAVRLLAFPAVHIINDPLYRIAQLGAHAAVPQPTVLYDDDFCMVWNKSAGMPVHESYKGQSGTLDEAAARHQLLADDPLPIRHIHRLDDDTSGPVLYAKNDLAQWSLDEAMRKKEIDRRYIAVVHGRLALLSGTVNVPIGKDRHHSSRRHAGAGGDQAITHYETVETYKHASIVRLRLETGRTHQIRVHMSYLGHPLIGDRLYGGDDSLLPHQALHGERLTFVHPWSGELTEVYAPEPDWLAKLLTKL